MAFDELSWFEVSLPYPPSVNRMWRHFRGRTVLSGEGKAYKADVQRLALAKGAELMTGPLRLRVKLLPKTKKDGTVSAVVMDLSNCLKVAEDALQGVCYANDRQVESIRLDYGDAVDGGGLIVRIEKLSGD